MTPQELTPYHSRLVDQNLLVILMLWWAAEHRKSDRTAVFEMPSALANRFINLELPSDFESFKAWGLRCVLNEQVWAFLAFRPSLLHQIDAQRPAWPLPRSCVMSDRLRGAVLVFDALGLMPLRRRQARHCQRVQVQGLARKSRRDLRPGHPVQLAQGATRGPRRSRQALRRRAAAGGGDMSVGRPGDLAKNFKRRG